MKNVLFTTFIPMIPVAKARARIGKFGGYTPSKTKNAELRIQMQVGAEYRKPLLDEPLSLLIVVFVTKPKSKSKKVVWPTAKPDADNYTKLVKDALNEIVWKDDACVVDERTIKVYTDNQPGFQIIIGTPKDKEVLLREVASLI